jgi:hypothetical protein
VSESEDESPPASRVAIARASTTEDTEEKLS